MGETLQGMLRWGAALGISDSSAPMTTLTPPPHNLCIGQTLAVAYFPEAGGRGLASARDIIKGESILRVPKSALLTTQHLLQTDHSLSLAVHKHPYLSSSQDSLWHPYLSNLPRYYDTLATFNQFEMQAFQVDDAIWAAERAKSCAESEWQQAQLLMQELKFKSVLLTFKAWLWASATISSRTLHAPWDEAGCLCPVGDLFNYSAPGVELQDGENATSVRSMQSTSLCNSRTADEAGAEQSATSLQRLTDGGFEENLKAYCFYARKNYEKGEQVLLSYGTYTNLELLEYYGFLLNENPNDKVYIPLETSIYSSSSFPKELMYIHQNGKPSFALLCTLRLWATPPNERRSIGHLAYAGAQLSAKNEMSVMGLILEKSNAILRKLPTSIEEDNHILCGIDKIHDFHTLMEVHKLLSELGGDSCAFLESTGLRESLANNQFLPCKIRRSWYRWKLAVQWRVRYKKTLLDCISYCTRTIYFLQSKGTN
ncbi:hypothetical protein CDL15_Pgr020333 [Punica granatum]|uniref:SET domain-containing protein n=1 Tax=Punica granatum TaxID=22663 RepID=A0A218VUY9_PUNGR|nr:hypothetical protein CDL15_Pgr020333 [Punica granatum]